MHLVYNGIEMECLEIPPDGFVMEAVYDDTQTDYLYTRVSITGLFLINGQYEVTSVTPITSYDINPTAYETLRQLWQRTAPEGAVASMPLSTGPAGLNNDSYGKVRCQAGPFQLKDGDGIYATSTQNESVPFVYKSVVPVVQTATTIRSRLLQPRGRLFVFTGSGDVGRKDEMLLLSPQWGTHTDCKNGPIPKVHSIQSFNGDARTLIASFSIETYINEMNSLIINETTNAINEQHYSPLLSNRFSMQHVIDEDSYLTLVTQGKAIFRTDFLYAVNSNNTLHNPDQFRFNLLLPVPFGCIREQINIEGLPDGTGVAYSYVDRQQYANFVMGPYANATQIQAIHRQAIVIDDDILSGALQTYERALQIRANRKFAAEEDPHPAKPKSGLNFSGLLQNTAPSK